MDNEEQNFLINGHLKEYPEFRQKYANLKISKIGVNAPVYFGVTDLWF